MKEIIRRIYGIEVQTIKRLNGYVNINYLISDGKSQWILKSYPFNSNLFAELEAETEVLRFLKDKHLNIPSPIAGLQGDYVHKVLNDEVEQIFRLLTFVEGEFMAEVKMDESLYESLGTYMAKIDLYLRDCHNSVISGRQFQWDLQYFELNRPYINYIDRAEDRRIIEYFFLQFDECVKPMASSLRKQIIYNDANEWNVLTKNGKVAGVIDFGDLAYSWLINEVAIALTYACYNLEEPLDCMAPILSSYHEVNPLESAEIDIIYYLIAARLCTSVCNSAHAKKTDPTNTYASSSEENALRTLRKWIAISPIGATNLFRRAVGLPELNAAPLESQVLKRQRHISEILSISYEEPLLLEKSAFQYMYDSYGNSILDAYNNIPHVGHCHPTIVKAGQRQMAKLNTNTRYIYEVLSEYAERLLAKFPSSMNKVYFVNSGSAASDLAIRLAKTHTKKNKLAVMEYGYHGNTQSSIDISDYKFNHRNGQGQKNHILKVGIPDTYRGPYKTNDGTAGQQYAEEAIKLFQSSPNDVAAFITEPIVGCGGQVPLAIGYLQPVYEAIRNQGGVCISDEVQTGFGRLGTHFWGFEAQNVQPDIVILGKPMGNGHPIGAVVCTDEIAESFSKGVEFFSSFGGNPVSCSIGLAVLEVIEKENLQQHALEVGKHYMSRLNELKHQFVEIGDVRGSGLFIGVEIVKEDGFSPNKILAHHIKNELRRNHILISTDGPYDSVLKTKPPLCFSKENADQVVDAIHNALSAATK